MKAEDLNFKTIKDEMVFHAHAYNKHLPLEFLRGLTTEELMAYTHPNYRDYFGKLLKE